MNSGQFPPGKSGNPRGRPPRSAARQDAADRARTVTRRDGWVNSASGHGTRRDRRMLTQYGVDIVTDVEALQLRRSEFLAAAIIEQGPKDALRRGWHLKCEDKELAAAITQQATALGVDDILYEAWTKELEAGGSAVFPVLTGALGDLSTPLDEGAIASVDAFHVFEPQELTPHDYYTDVRSPKFRRPETYRLIPLTTGRSGWMPPTIIHETRLVIFPGQRHTVQTQPGQRMSWGDSVLCRPRQVIADFGLAWGSAATLLAGHGGGTLEMEGFANLMASQDGMATFDNYIASMEMAMSTLRTRVIDGKDKFTREASTLAGVAEVLDKFATLIAAAARRPVSILMGRGETGLRTGDDDTRSWYATVEGDRAKHLLPRHQQIIRLMLLATAGPSGGKEPEGWGIEYPPLWSPSEKEIADTRKTNMDRAVAAVTAQIVSADDVAESFYPEDGDGKGDVRGDIRIDWQRRKAQAAIAAQSAEDLSAEDQAAMGGEGDLTDEELAQLEALRSEFGTEDDGEEPADDQIDEDQ